MERLSLKEVSAPSSVISPRILMDSNLLPTSEHQILRPTPLRAAFIPAFDKPEGDNSPSKANGISRYERLPPERDVSSSKPSANQGFVTNVMIDRSCSIADSGYQILEDGEEEERRSLRHQHPSITQGKSSLMKYKPKRKQPPFDKTPQSYQEEEDLSKTLEKANRLLDVKAAIEQMTVSKKNGRVSSSSSDEDNDEIEEDLDDGSTNVFMIRHSDKHSNVKHVPNNHGKPQKSHGKPPRKQLSQETLNTTVTSAGDEFVWIDSHNRLVELQSVPWNNDDIRSALPNRGSSVPKDRISLDLLPRVSYYLQRVLVRLSREIQRLSKPVGKCGTREILSAIKITLAPSLAESAVKACLRAAAMFAISGDATRQTKSARAGLRLRVGKMHQWMCLVKLGKFVHETAAIYLTAAIECILEELMLFCLDYHSKSSREPSPNAASSNNNATNSSPTVPSSPLLSATLLEQAIMINSDYWGLFQPYAHLGIGRTSSGTLVVPSVYSNDSSHVSTHKSKTGKSLDQILLTTCVGTVQELEEMVSMVTSLYGSINNNNSVNTGRRSVGKSCPLSWSQEALDAFYHFMRCSQLEYVGEETRAPIQELVYERPYVVLPPLMEWVRVACAFAEHREAQLVDKNDVMQAARVLLPGMDYPIRLPFSSAIHSSPPELLDELQYVNDIKLDTAFKMLLSGRRDLIPHALQMLPGGPEAKLSAPNSEGYTFLQLAALKGDPEVVKLLVETGAEVDGKTSRRKWTPLCYASVIGNPRIVKYLLDKGARVEGAHGTLTETPLQLAAGSGSCRVAELLLAHGASPFYTADEDENGEHLTFVSQDGCVSAVSVAAIHGHRRLLHTLVTHVLTSPPDLSLSPGGENQVLSLEEILAEGSTVGEDKNKSSDPTSSSSTNKSFIHKLSKSHVKRLQEAMYHASESGNLEITLDLRNMGVPWTLHTWLLSIAVVDSNNRSSGYLDELLQDFLTEWQQHDEQGSKYFVEDGLSLLFSMFRNCKSEGTLLLLADIFSACYGRSEINPILCSSPGRDDSFSSLNGNSKRSSSSLSTNSSSSSSNAAPTPAPRIDPKFVNNPELSDVQFRVDGRIFYAHKLVLITASSRFQSMINSRYCEGIPPVLQINDIRYDIFHLVMVYLYNGGSDSLSVKASDVLELMAAANFFQLPGLLEYCESRCSNLIDLDNIVSYYIHAKVYSAHRLLEYCEGFLLQNMAALLTYDDSVKRLIFGKKLQSHDVLSGLLKTLQKRMSSRSKQH